MDIRAEDLQYIKNCLSFEERKKFEGATIVITGCAGFLGYYFMHFFDSIADEFALKRVIALDNFMLGKPLWLHNIKHKNKFEIHNFDMIHDEILDIKEATNANYVIHMASIASPVYYRQHPIKCVDANVWGLRKLLEFYALKKVKGFLFFSSSEVYGNPDEVHVPTEESYWGNVSFTGPRACYDEAKRFSETLCSLFAQQYKMPIGVVRPFNNYGPGMKINDKRLPADLANSVLSGNDIEIFSDGTPTRTFCYVADALVGYLKVLLYGHYDYFNIGMDIPEISVTQLATIYQQVAKELFNYQGKIVYHVSEDQQYLTHNPQRRCPKIEKARELLGYQPSIEVHEGVKRFLMFLNENEQSEYLW